MASYLIAGGCTEEAVLQTYYSLAQGQLYATRRGDISASNGQSCIDLSRHDMARDMVDLVTT